MRESQFGEHQTFFQEKNLIDNNDLAELKDKASVQMLSLFSEKPEEIANESRNHVVETHTECLALPDHDIEAEMAAIAGVGVGPENEFMSVEDFFGRSDAEDDEGGENEGQRQDDEYCGGVYEHEDLVGNREAFGAAIKEFHARRQSRLTVPNVDGWELDMFMFYRVITSCGGLRQVIKDGKWPEVAEGLNVPTTIVNASFFLRKHYMDLLYDFENYYYGKGNGGVHIKSLGLLPAPLTVENGAVLSPVTPSKSIKKRKRKRNNLLQLFGVDPGAAVGHCVTGAIESKFDGGYLVTVVVGSEKMGGVLYHTPEEDCGPQFAVVPGLINGGPGLNDLGFEVEVSKKKREYSNKKDPNAPRQSRSGYNYFYMETCAKFKENRPDFDREMSKVVAEMWSKLSEQGKKPYIEQSEKDKERYRREMNEYKSRLNAEANDNNVSCVNVDGKENGSDANTFYLDGRNDYHVSLETADDMPSIEEQPEEIIVSGTGHQMYTNQVAEHTGEVAVHHGLYTNHAGEHLYPVLAPVPQSSGLHIHTSTSLTETFTDLTDTFSYQHEIGISNNGHMNTLNFPIVGDLQMQRDPQGEEAFSVQDSHS